MKGCEVGTGNVIDFAFGPKGAVWVATGLSLLRVDEDGWTSMDRLVHSVEVAADGSAWVSGWEGRQGSAYVARLREGDWREIGRVPGGLATLTAGPDDLLWGIEQSGSRVSFLNGEEWVLGADIGAVTALEPGPDDSLWAAGEKGVFRYDGQRWIPVASGIDVGPVTALAFGPGDIIWLGTGEGVMEVHLGEVPG